MSFEGNREVTERPKTASKGPCQHCGHELLIAPSGRRKTFCSDRCRQASRKAISAHNGPKYRGGPKTVKAGLQDAVSFQEFKPKTPALKTKPPHFEKVNEVTWKLTDGELTNVAGSHGQWAGYR